MRQQQQQQPQHRSDSGCQSPRPLVQALQSHGRQGLLCLLPRGLLYVLQSQQQLLLRHGLRVMCAMLSLQHMHLAPPSPPMTP